MLPSIVHWRRVFAQAPHCVHLILVGSQELHHIRILPFRRSTRTEWTLGSALQVRRVPAFDDQLHVPRPGDVTIPVLVAATASTEVFLLLEMGSVGGASSFFEPVDVTCSRNHMKLYIFISELIVTRRVT